MNNRQLLALASVTLILSSAIAPALCLPAEGRPLVRKFAEKPNNLKKVAIDRNDLDDVSTNSISDSGFSWSNILGMIMQMIFHPGQQAGPNKSDFLDTDQGPAPSPWANIISVGLKILTTILGGGPAVGGFDGIDKVDNPSPMQGILAAVLSTMLGSKDPDQVASMAKQAGEFINIVVNLLDALKTSFSHRSLAARSLGKKDSMSEAATAAVVMAKAYARSFATSDVRCLQRNVCEANIECINDVPGSNTYCQLGGYGMSMLLERTSSGSYEDYQQAGRDGRSGANCRQIYSDCQV